MSRSERGERQQHKPKGSPWLEWTASGIGLLLAVGAIAFIVWKGITAADLPPEIELAVQNVVDRQPGYTVEIRAANRSSTTAATVVVEGELKRGDRTVETSETTFDFVPGHSERQGGLYFREDPRQFELELRPRGYVRP